MGISLFNFMFLKFHLFVVHVNCSYDVVSARWHHCSIITISSSDNTDNPRTWPMNTWNSRWANLSTPLHRYISSPSTNPISHDLHRHWWDRLNRMRTGYGRFGQQMVRMGRATDPSCSCGCAVQTAHHAIYDCPITRCPGDFTTLDLRARDWLHTTQLKMWHVVHVTRSINQSISPW